MAAREGTEQSDQLTPVLGQEMGLHALPLPSPDVQMQDTRTRMASWTGYSQTHRHHNSSKFRDGRFDRRCKQVRMTSDERKAVRAMLANHGVRNVWRTKRVDSEQIILIPTADYERVDAGEILRELYRLLPNRKLGLVPHTSHWHNVEPV